MKLNPFQKKTTRASEKKQKSTPEVYSPLTQFVAQITILTLDFLKLDDKFSVVVKLHN